MSSSGGNQRAFSWNLMIKYRVKWQCRKKREQSWQRVRHIRCDIPCLYFTAGLRRLGIRGGQMVLGIHHNNTVHLIKMTLSRRGKHILRVQIQNSWAAVRKPLGILLYECAASFYGYHKHMVEIFSMCASTHNAFIDGCLWTKHSGEQEAIRASAATMNWLGVNYFV